MTSIKRETQAQKFRASGFGWEDGDDLQTAFGIAFEQGDARDAAAKA
jgi:hypothetical protein